VATIFPRKNAAGSRPCHTVLRQLEKLEANYKLFNSRMTAKGLFRALEKAQDAVHVLEDSQGVLGLQRAFHAAGARTTVCSLWSVHDAATSVLMEEFYKRLWAKQKLSKLEALRQAQRFVLDNPEAVLKPRPAPGPDGLHL
jgi:hypothetical protein